MERTRDLDVHVLWVRGEEEEKSVLGCVVLRENGKGSVLAEVESSNYRHNSVQVRIERKKDPATYLAIREISPEGVMPGLKTLRIREGRLADLSLVAGNSIKMIDGDKEEQRVSFVEKGDRLVMVGVLGAR